MIQELQESLSEATYDYNVAEGCLTLIEVKGGATVKEFDEFMKNHQQSKEEKMMRRKVRKMELTQKEFVECKLKSYCDSVKSHRS